MLTPDDLRLAAEVSLRTLEPHVGSDWSVKAGDLEWSCRYTLDHIVDALAYYSGHLATLSDGPIQEIRDGIPSGSPSEVLANVGVYAAVLARVCEASPAGARAWHSAGTADTSGFLPMGCDEILVHTFDIANGLGVRN